MQNVCTDDLRLAGFSGMIRTNRSGKAGYGRGLLLVRTGTEPTDFQACERVDIQNAKKSSHCACNIIYMRHNPDMGRGVPG